ncbi:aldehyde dehydrogenase [Paenibacillus terrigena]|uniref:aldehyde dehydrogenase n=1 Tax=Paenibacillus terrigena TaxID=369333 RepID=UPI000368FDC6|nr:aldehyde dehydrogenase [Paenibacillus terrigena]
MSNLEPSSNLQHENIYSALIHKQKAFFGTHQTKSLAFRKDALNKLGDAIRKYEQPIIQALKSDLNKSEFEAYSTEVGILLKEIRFFLKHLHTWARPKKVKTPLTHFGSKSSIYAEPYGVVLIIAPWNFPFQLAIAPLIGAIAAGNCAIIKPSELTPKTSEVIAALVQETYAEEYIAVVQGDVGASQALLREKTDYIFFTGSIPVGKVIMEAAAKHLTPVTLELGGKSPCIVHKDANLKLAAKRIAWGKFMNAGQTCVAPDYIYVHRSVKASLITHLKDAIQQLYGANPLDNENYTRVVSDKHFMRLEAMLHEGTLVAGGRSNRDTLRIEPTILTDVTANDLVMQDEIFGPILPILEYDRIEDVLQEIDSCSKPLALYIFSENREIQQQVLTHASFGGGCVNDTVYHFTTPYLPFGGVGSSGMGNYHGKAGFDLFSHRKSVLRQTTLFDIPFRYPHIKDGLKRIKMFLK